MAKREAQEVVTIWVAPNDVIWFPQFNSGRHNSLVDDTKKQNEHAVLIGTPGRFWLSKESIPVCKLQTEDGGPNFIGTTKMAVQAIEALKAQLSGTHPEETFPTIPTPTKLNAAQLREGFNALYYPGGELHVPKYDGVACFQRGPAIFKAVALLIAGGMKAEEAVASMRVPIEILTFKDESERVIKCGEENTTKDTGRVSIMNHWPSLYKLGKALFDSKGGTATQNSINTLVCGGDVKNFNKGIRVHSLLILDQRFPALGITSKILDAKTDKDGLDIGQKFVEGLDRTQIWKMAQWLDAAKFESDLTKGDDAATIRASSGGKGSTTEEEVADYLADPASFKDQKVQMASKAVINTRMNNTPNLIEKYILNAVTTGRMERLSKLNAPALTIEQLQKMNEYAQTIGLVDVNGTLVP